MWVEHNFRCNNGAQVISIIKLQWFSVFQCEKTDLIYLPWGPQTHKTKLTSVVHQLQPQCSRHFRINKGDSFILITFKCQIIIQPIHVSKYIGITLLGRKDRERLKWVCQLTGLRGIAATTDALLLLFQIRFTKHGLWLHTVWTAESALSASLFACLGSMVYHYVIPQISHNFTLFTFQQAERVGVQGQGRRQFTHS